jgi:hypothetical protein
MKISLSFFKLLFCISLISFANNSIAQKPIEKDTAYQKILQERTAKILKPLNISKAKLYSKVQQILIEQYKIVNKVHDDYKNNTAAMPSKNLSSNDIAFEKAKLEELKKVQLKELHQRFVKKLNKKLDVTQVEQIKDGMTYSVLPKTWSAYLDMLPSLTQEQKDKMYIWLLEAREFAMDEGSSDAKHAVFGIYKGKINNYLSAQGYDMKKEGQDWAARIKAEKEKKQNPSN